MFDKPQRLRVKRTVGYIQVGAQRYLPEDVFEAGAAHAETLVGEGWVEVA